jgi:hypothetical protein
MGSPNGDAGYLLNDFSSTEGAHAKIWRNVGVEYSKPDGTPDIKPDEVILSADNFDSFQAFENIGAAHRNAHRYIGGTLTDPHFSFHDPFVFLLHSNLDRLWARWQTDPRYPERMKAPDVYSGLFVTETNTLANDKVEPWAGGTGLEPWALDPNTQIKNSHKKTLINYFDPSIVNPPSYDTNHHGSLRLLLNNRNIPLPASLRNIAKNIGLISPISIIQLMRELS